MTPELEKRLTALSNTSKGLPFIVEMLERGDFPDPTENAEVKRWVRTEAKRRRKAFLRTPEGSAIRQADAAMWALWTAILALAVSVVALWKSWA